MRFLWLILLFLPLSINAEEEERNALIVCEHGLEMLDWDLEFLRHAEQSVEISCPLSGGSIFRKVLSILEERLRAAPELHVWILPSPLLQEEEDKRCIAELQKTYPERFHFVLTSKDIEVFPGLISVENHIKCLIVDGTYFSIGGTNLDDSQCTDGTYTPPRNQKGGIAGPWLPAGLRDMDVVGRGPIAKLVREKFYQIYSMWEDYHRSPRLKIDLESFSENPFYRQLDPSRRPFVMAFETSPRLREVPKVRFLLGGPHQRPNRISKEYEHLVNSAKKEIVIANLYSQPVDFLMNALTKAAEKGIDLTLLTNGLHAKNPYLCNFFAWANRMSYVPLMYGRGFHFWEEKTAAKRALCSTQIFEYRVDDIVYHKKVMVIDKGISVIGSYNLGAKSDVGDYEDILVIDSPEIAQDILNVLEKDKLFSKEISPQQARSWYFDPSIEIVAKNQKKMQQIW